MCKRVVVDVGHLCLLFIWTTNPPTTSIKIICAGKSCDLRERTVGVGDINKTVPKDTHKCILKQANGVAFS